MDFKTHINQKSINAFDAKFNYKGQWYYVGCFKSEQEASIQVLLAFQRHVRDQSSKPPPSSIVSFSK